MKNNSFNQTGGRRQGEGEVSRERHAKGGRELARSHCPMLALFDKNWPAFYLKKQRVCELAQTWSSCRADVCAPSPRSCLVLVVSVVQSTLPAVSSQAIISDVYVALVVSCVVTQSLSSRPSLQKEATMEFEHTSSANLIPKQISL